MALYLISLELHHRRPYTELYELMGQWNAKRLLETVWLAELRGPAGDINGFVLATLDHDDAASTIELKAGAQWAVMRGHSDGISWLQVHFPHFF